MNVQDTNAIMAAAVPIYVQLVDMQGNRLRTVDLEVIYASLRTSAIHQAMLIYNEVRTTDLVEPLPAKEPR